MKRLTVDTDLSFCDIAQCDSIPGGSFCEDGRCDQRRCYEKLREYERSRVKERPGSGTWWYWLRSPYGSDSAYFCDVSSGGNASCRDASIARGVAFGFCL